MLRARSAALTLAAAAAVTATSCGSFTDSSTRSTSAPTPALTGALESSASVKKTSPLTRTQLIARADAICGRISTKRNLLKFGVAGSLVVILPQLTAYERELFVELSRLTPPSSMASGWDQIVADAHTLDDSTAELNRDAQTNHTKGAQSLFAIFARARQQLQSTAKRSGLAVCARY
jgi:hypothetical protein